MDCIADRAVSVVFKVIEQACEECGMEWKQGFVVIVWIVCLMVVDAVAATNKKAPAIRSIFTS